MTSDTSGQAGPTIEMKVRALEELRTADRLLLSAQGMLHHVTTQQLLDLGGHGSNEGLFGENERREVGRANETLLEAQSCVRNALQNLGLEPGDDIAELKKWGFTEWALDGLVFDFLAMRKAALNLSVVNETRDEVRKLFAHIHGSDQELQQRVEPLAVDDEDGLLDQADHFMGLVGGVNPRFWTPLHWIAFVAGGIVLLIAILSSIYGYIADL